MASTVTVNILGDAKSLKAALGEAEQSLAGFQAKAKAFGDAATSAGQQMSIGLTLPLIGAFKLAYDELTQSANAAAQTEAAIRSTGGAAQVTAGQVDQLVQSLMRKTGIDDAVIQSGANVILTFTNVRNEAGKGNDIFNQAVQAALDLSVAFGKDLTSSALVVGKALQDPVAGVTALRRVGVQLNETQQEQIANFVALGDTMSAQKIILEELKTEVGGSADAYGKTLSGQVGRAKEELSNAGAAILSTAVPAMRHLAEFAVGVAQAFSHLPGPVKEAVVVLGGIVAAMGPLNYMAGSAATLFSGFIGVVRAVPGILETLALKAMYAAEALRAMSFAQIAAAAAPIAIAAAVVIAAVAIDRFVGDSDEAMQKFVKAAKGGQTAGHELAAGMIAAAQSSSAPLAELRARLEEVRKEHDQMVKAAQGGKIGMEQFVRGTAEYRAAAGDLKKEIGAVKLQQIEAAAAAAQQKADIDALATGTKNWADVTDGARQAVIALRNAMSGNDDAMFALDEANRKLYDSTLAYYQALESGDPAKIAEAERALQRSRLDVANATDRAADAHGTFLDLLQQGPAAIQTEINKLAEERAAYGDTSGVLSERIERLQIMKQAITTMPKNWPVDILVNADMEQLREFKRILDAISGVHTTVVNVVTNSARGIFG